MSITNKSNKKKNAMAVKQKQKPDRHDGKPTSQT